MSKTLHYGMVWGIKAEDGFLDESVHFLSLRPVIAKLETEGGMKGRGKKTDNNNKLSGVCM